MKGEDQRVAELKRNKDGGKRKEINKSSDTSSQRDDEPSEIPMMKKSSPGSLEKKTLQNKPFSNTNGNSKYYESSLNDSKEYLINERNNDSRNNNRDRHEHDNKFDFYGTTDSEMGRGKRHSLDSVYEDDFEEDDPSEFRNSSKSSGTHREINTSGSSKSGISKENGRNINGDKNNNRRDIDSNHNGGKSQSSRIDSDDNRNNDNRNNKNNNRNNKDNYYQHK